MNRLNRFVSVGALVAAVGAAVSLAWQESPTRPNQPNQPGQPGTQPRDPSRPNDPMQPGTQPRDPSQPDSPTIPPRRDPMQPDTTPRQPGQPDLTRPDRDLTQPRDTTRDTTRMRTTTTTQITLGQPVTREVVDQVIVSWPAEPKRFVTMSFEKFGPPAAVTADTVVWHDVGPWSKVVVLNEPVKTNFPSPHEEFLITYLPMKVPAAKACELMNFDGGIIVNRTVGEVGVLADREELATATFNLAYDIIQGTKTVQEARGELARITMGLEQGTTDPITQELKFEVAKAGETGDLDEPFSGTNRPGMDRPGMDRPGLDRPLPSTPGTTKPTDPNRRPGGG